MTSSEELRETLVALSRENERLRAETGRANLLLSALERLLRLGETDDPFAGVFAALRDVFAFESAMVLAESLDEQLDCIAAIPASLTGLRFASGPFVERVMAGRVTATFTNSEMDEWSDLSLGLIAPEQPALFLPIRVRERRGLVALLRPVGQPGFDRAHVALARKFAVLASHALAARDASRSEAESRHLRDLMLQLRRSEREAQRNADLLNEIVSVLPVGLTVRDDTGKLILMNDAASAMLTEWAVAAGENPAAAASGTEPRLYDPAVDGAVPPGQTLSLEKTLMGMEGERTLLATFKPVQIFDETLLLSTAMDITERKRVENELAQRAYYDVLTGLPNRILIEERVEAMLQQNGGKDRLALAFIDLDNFKHINDYYSHAIGDALLVAVAQRIVGRVRPSDVLARISGDEFVLMVSPLESDEALREMIGGILKELQQPFAIEGFNIFTSASIGVSLFPEHGANYEELRRNADTAMYRAKTGAKGGVAYFDLSMGHAVTARMELEQDLRQSIRDQLFRCAFQPKVDIRSGRLVGLEALVRKYDPDGRVHAPGEFVGLATELGLIDQIARFVLGDAVAAMPLIDSHFGPDTSISINIAAKQASDLAFMMSFAEALRDTGRADRFMLEITEDAFVATAQLQSKVLPLLRNAGVRVSIDDFGTGYSSLAALADITADEIKVDRSFITGIHQRPRSQSVLKAIESLSHALGITVVAEGVETLEELIYLSTATRILTAQGYYFAKPMLVEDLVASWGRQPLALPPAASARHVA